MSDNLLEISSLHVQYKTDDALIYAVNGLELTIKKGETLGLVGETGAGKTTTALSIMKLLPQGIGFVTNGKIFLEDIDILSLTEADMRLLRGQSISMIFQDPMTSLNPIMSIGDQIEEVLTLHKKDMSNEQKSKKIDEILELIGIPLGRKNDYPYEFSGGMRQRVVIAIALACEPMLLLADEPTTALDVTIQAQVLEMMKELKKTYNTSMILISHDLGVVAQVCNRVAIMYAGEIIELGSVRDIFEAKKHHPYTLGLFGSIPNLEKSSRRLNPIEGLTPDPTNLPTGCSFHPRCPNCLPICKLTSPAKSIESSHMIKCHLYGSINQDHR